MSNLKLIGHLKGGKESSHELTDILSYSGVKLKMLKSILPEGMLENTDEISINDYLSCCLYYFRNDVLEENFKLYNQEKELEIHRDEFLEAFTEAFMLLKPDVRKNILHHVVNMWAGSITYRDFYQEMLSKFPTEFKRSDEEDGGIILNEDKCLFATGEHGQKMWILNGCEGAGMDYFPFDKIVKRDPEFLRDMTEPVESFKTFRNRMIPNPKSFFLLTSEKIFFMDFINALFPDKNVYHRVENSMNHLNQELISIMLNDLKSFITESVGPGVVKDMLRKWSEPNKNEIVGHQIKEMMINPEYDFDFSIVAEIFRVLDEDFRQSFIKGFEQDFLKTKQVEKIENVETDTVTFEVNPGNVLKIIRLHQELKLVDDFLSHVSDTYERDVKFFDYQNIYKCSKRKRNLMDSRHFLSPEIYTEKLDNINRELSEEVYLLYAKSILGNKFMEKIQELEPEGIEIEIKKVEKENNGKCYSVMSFTCPKEDAKILEQILPQIVYWNEDVALDNVDKIIDEHLMKKYILEKNKEAAPSLMQKRKF